MKLLARIVSRRVRALETTLDAQRAQTLTWRTHHKQAQQATIGLADHYQAALDNAAAARVEHDRLATVLADCEASKARIAGERNAALRELKLLRNEALVADVRYPIDRAAYEDALTVAQRRARAAEDNCLRLENQLAGLEGRPLVGSLR